MTFGAACRSVLIWITNKVFCVFMFETFYWIWISETRLHLCGKSWKEKQKYTLCLGFQTFKTVNDKFDTRWSKRYWRFSKLIMEQYEFIFNYFLFFSGKMLILHVHQMLCKSFLLGKMQNNCFISYYTHK